ncbi:hypothetical protein Tco_0697048 [Tanacetum coccineum]
MACSLPHTDSEVEALVQRLINEDKGHQDALLNLAFQFEDSCAVRDDLRNRPCLCRFRPEIKTFLGDREGLRRLRVIALELVLTLINEDKGRQDALLNLAFQFEDPCAVRDDLRKTYKKCNDLSQESRALNCTLLKESSDTDRKLHLSMYGKAAQLERQMGAKLAWFQEEYSDRTHGGIGCSSSQANCPLTEKELHQLRMDEEALKEMLEEEAMNKKA